MSAKSLKERLKNATDKPSIPAGNDPPQQAVEARFLGARFGYKFFNINAAPLENLVQTGRMETREDDPQISMIRLTVARRLVDAFEGAYIGGLRSPDLEPSVSGGGGGRPISDYRIDCAMTIDRVRCSLSSSDFKIIEGFCYRDQYIWRGLPRKQEQVKILMVHKALDRAGAAMGMIRPDAVKQRWAKRPRSNPKLEPEPKTKP